MRVAVGVKVGTDAVRAVCSSVAPGAVHARTARGAAVRGRLVPILQVVRARRQQARGLVRRHVEGAALGGADARERKRAPPALPTPWVRAHGAGAVLSSDREWS